MNQHRHDLEEEGKARDALTNGLELHNGIAIPRDMSLPGQDGYRTPNVHDYERTKLESDEETHPTTGAKTPPPSAGLFSNLANLSRIELSLERLHWRERIRHYTWTFFTMTMATGGIANVLYAGNLARRRNCCLLADWTLDDSSLPFSRTLRYWRYLLPV